MTRLLGILAPVLAIPVMGPGTATETFVAHLTGEQAVPAVITPAGGAASFWVEGDSVIRYKLEVARIRDVWGAAIHAAAPGKTGAKAVTLFTGPRYFETNGVLAEGTFRAGDMLGDVTVPELARLMREKKAYVEVFTARHPGGEIRGQIRPAAEVDRLIAMR